ncbi:MAG: hypothetical protein KBS41_04450 [Oscillospiraceae bacterium]|nr:hypothetical protein [Candidatus Equicaccousia limihippi]
MKYFQNWQLQNKGKTGSENGKIFAATVPGNIQSDYAKFIGIDNIMYADNAKALEKTEDDFFEYFCDINFTAKQGEKLFFVAEGIDYKYDVFLSGKKLFGGEGMYKTVEIDISGAKCGERLSVLIYPHPRINKHIKNRDDAARSCKPPVTYGWDWNPRLLISGLWKPCYLETRNSDYISPVAVKYELSKDLKSAKVRFVCKTDGKAIYSIKDRNGNVVYKGEKPCCTLKNIDLWWPNGEGEQSLYEYTVKTAGYKRSGKIGFKQIRLVQNIGTANEPEGFPHPRYVTFITVEINGRRIFAKGSNMVNLELFFGEVQKKRCEEAVKLAADCNMNILRIWGGAGLLKPEFYEACDKYGIMVWQEFMLACNNYEGTPHYLKTLESEATAVISLMQNHASLCLWCGGNELFNSWSGMDDNSPALRLLNKLCYELTPEIPFLSTSPMCGMAHGGYTFCEPSGRECFDIFQKAQNSAYTEFGVPSISPRKNLEKVIPKKELFPFAPTDAYVYHHGYYAWMKNTWLCEDAIERYFGKSESLDLIISRSQWMQCEGYKGIFEEARRQWPHCSMAVNWCFNEPWITAGNNSLIAYPNIKKPAYYAVKDSLRPTLFSAKITKFLWRAGEKMSFDIYLLNDGNQTVTEKATVYAVVGTKRFELATFKTTAKERTNTLCPTVNFILPNIKADTVKIEIKSASGKYDSEYKLVYKPDLSVKPKEKRLNAAN